MLKVFRDNLKYLSWVLWLVIAVFILFVFVDFGGTVPGSSDAPNAAAVTVGRQKITYGEFQRAYDQFEDFYRQSMGEQFSRELARQIGLPVQVLNRLVADRVLAEEGRRMGLAITDEELRNEILRQFGGNFTGAEEYRRILRASGLTPKGFESSLRRDLLAEKTRTVLAANLYIPDEDVERAYRDRVERAKIRYVKLAAADLAAEVVVVPEELESFFADNLEEYRIPERRVVTYLSVDRQAIQVALEIGVEEVQAYYDENPGEFTRDEEVQARHILVSIDPTATTDQEGRDRARSAIEDAKRRIETGTPFEVVAAEISEDPGSKNNGGDLGYFGRGAMVPPFENAAFGAELGTLVGPVETDFGFHLIEVLDKRAGGLQPLAEVEPLIRQRLASTRGAAATEGKARDLADRIAREGLAPPSWEQLAVEETAVSVETTPAFGRGDYVEGIGSATAFSSRAFDLPPGEVSEPLPVGGGWVILAVDSIEEPRYPELDEVRAEVEADAREERQLTMALARLEEAAASLGEGDTLDRLADELGLEAVESSLFGRTDAVGTLGRNPEISETALALEVGEIGAPVALADGAVLFEVLERERFDAIRFAEDKDSEQDALREQRLGELLTSLIQARREEMGVTYDPQLIANFELDGQVGS